MVLGYSRVSTYTQTTLNQKHAILEFAHNNKLHVDEIIEVTTSSRKHRKERLIDETLEKITHKDILIVYSLDRLGRSTIETLNIIQDIKQKGITLIIIKEGLTIEPYNDNPLNQMLLTMLTAVADLERSFISERTKAGLARVKANGTKLGRQKGQKVKSKFDEYKEDIIRYKAKGLPLGSIIKLIELGTVQGLGNYLKSREIA